MLARMLSRRAGRETVGVEAVSGHDGQGQPTYADPENISAFVIEEDKAVTGADGSDVRTSLTVHVPQDETPVPDENDRLTYDGRTFIVVEKYQGRRITGTVVYHRVRARDE